MQDSSGDPSVQFATSAPAPTAVKIIIFGAGDAGTQLILVAMNLERIADRVTNLAEDLVFLETGNVEELG